MNIYTHTYIHVCTYSYIHIHTHVGRWTKIEQTVRAGLQHSGRHLHAAFQVTSRDTGGKKLDYTQLKSALNSCGFPMSDLDFEKMWRRVDRECLGQVFLFFLQILDPLKDRERERGSGRFEKGRVSRSDEGESARERARAWCGLRVSCEMFLSQFSLFFV